MEKLDQVAAFVKAVELGSFSAAATDLGLSPSAVSKQVSQLEERLGVQLLQRSTRRLTLTAVGHNYYDRCGLALKEMRAAEADAICHDDRLRGLLRIQATAGVGHRLIMPLALDFMAIHPEVEIALSIESVASYHALARDADCLITVTHRAETQGAQIASTELSPISYVICAAPSYIATFGRPKTIDDLSRHDCVIHEAQKAPRVWRFSQRGRDTTVTVRGRFSSNHALAVERAVLAGHGVARIPAYVASPHAKAGRLVILFQSAVAWGQVITAYYPSGPRSARLKAFLDFARAGIARQSRSSDGTRGAPGGASGRQ